ncbi:MAG: DUF2513 domain-containing protein [bacterium]
MKRNKDLIRDILLFAGSKNGQFEMTFDENYDTDAGIDFPDYKTGDVVGHFKLLIDDDYIDGEYFDIESGIILSVSINSITMKGYDLLDAIRDKGIWAEVKNELGVAGESWSLEVMAKLAIKILAKKVGL